jgi:hypothetical protein
MKTVENVHKQLVGLLQDLEVDPKIGFVNDYEWGMDNAIECILAYIESRPAFYRDRQGKHSKKDMQNFPEYFV